MDERNVPGSTPNQCSHWYAKGFLQLACNCLLYTSDAADERSSVDLGGRRIIKKKTIHDSGHLPYALIKNHCYRGVEYMYHS